MTCDRTLDQNGLLICSSVFVLRKYKIGRKEHQEILRQLAERDGE